ncbi:MarR family winged helix-turn-helix transcriptional regulator [Ilumatobacter sp.]|uniref:MarR family winged helix-turn-helix transcriptional regulator n=1 Tax=Ilumatobacter sp. TaxID=1967498 RepID=UPI003B51A327
MSGTDDVPWLSPLEERAWRGLQFMQMRLDAEIGGRLSADSPLSYQDYIVLIELTDRADGQVRQFELVRDLGWEKSRLSHHVTRMESRGLVEKRKCPSDRRGAFVGITPAGTAAIEAAAPGHLEAVRDAFVDHLDEHELEVFATVCERILDNLDDAPDT